MRDASNDMTGLYSYGGDFYPIWLTGRELFLHRTNPYTQQTTREIQTGLFGRPMDPRRPADPPIEFRAFAYPLYTDLLAAPLLPLGFETVRGVLAVLLPVLTGASVVLWLRAFHLRLARGTLAVAPSPCARHDDGQEGGVLQGDASSRRADRSEVASRSAGAGSRRQRLGQSSEDAIRRIRSISVRTEGQVSRDQKRTGT